MNTFERSNKACLTCRIRHRLLRLIRATRTLFHLLFGTPAR